VDNGVEGVGTVWGVVVDERFTTVWTAGKQWALKAADLHRRHPPAVEDTKISVDHPFGLYLSVVALNPADSEDASDAPPNVEVRRSARRRRTVSAYRDGDRTVVLIPARMSHAEEQHWVDAMIARLARQESRLRPSDEALLSRAASLSERYLGGQARAASVRWVANQRHRWGSCTPSDRTIRLSARLRGMPEYVVDYVLLHELAHLLVPGHGPEFWRMLAQYPKTDRARGYLDGVAATAHLDLSDEAD
jgi:predicted metal-dependent hydrolase